MAELSAEIRMYFAVGSQRLLLQGGAITKATAVDCPDYWFSGESTTVLGGYPASTQLTDNARIPQAQYNGGKTIASWSISVDRYSITHSSSGRVLIGCRRYFGGLHSERR